MAIDLLTGRAPETSRPNGDRTEPTEPRCSLPSFAGFVRGRSVDASNALIGGVVADAVHLERGVARTVFAGGMVELRQAGAQAVVSNGAVRLERAGTGIAVGRRIDVGQGGFVVFALAPSLQITGGRVLVGPLGGLLALGAVVAVGLAGARMARRTKARR